MRFEWDESKRLINLNRHRIDFADVDKIFAGETLTLLDDRFAYEETRFVTFGLLFEKVVAVVHTEADDVIRVISIRRASKDEETTYFKEIRD